MQNVFVFMMFSFYLFVIFPFLFFQGVIELKQTRGEDAIVPKVQYFLGKATFIMQVIYGPLISVSV